MINTSKLNAQNQYTLSKLVIVSNGIEYDITKTFVEINLYESILQNFMSGDVVLVDTQSAIPFLDPDSDFTEIKLTFNTNGIDSEIQFTGVIYKTEQPGRVSPNASGYILKFVSKNQVENAKIMFSKKVEGEVSKMVSDIYNDYLSTEKRIVVMPTKEVYKYILPWCNPIEAINLLSRKSVSINDEYGYLFYETSQDQRYLPVELLYKQHPIEHYKHKNPGVYEDSDQREQEMFTAIQSYEPVSNPSPLSDITYGLTGSEWLSFSLWNKEVVINNYDPNVEYKPEKSLGDGLSTARSTYNPKSFIGFDVCDEYDSSRITKYRTKMALLRLQTQQMKIVISGNSILKAGDVIRLTVPVFSAFDDTESDMDTYSGNYVISDIRHVLRKDSYTQHIKVTRDTKANPS